MVRETAADPGGRRLTSRRSVAMDPPHLDFDFLVLPVSRLARIESNADSGRNLRDRNGVTPARKRPLPLGARAAPARRCPFPRWKRGRSADYSEVGRTVAICQGRCTASQGALHPRAVQGSGETAGRGSGSNPAGWRCPCRRCPAHCRVPARRPALPKRSSAQRRRGQHAQRAGGGGRAVGQDVAENVAGDHDVELRRRSNQLHGGVIDVEMAQLHIREFPIVQRRNLVAPQFAGFQDIGLVDRAKLAPTLARQLEREAGDALHFVGGVGLGVEAAATSLAKGLDAPRLTE